MNPSANIVTPGPNVHQLKVAREIRGAYGESAGVYCPFCHTRLYPQRRNVDICDTCGTVFRVPDGYSHRAQKINDSSLSRFLRKEHLEAGLYLAENDDHILSLMHGEKAVAAFSTHALLEFIIQAADQWLNEQKNGVSFEAV